MKSIKEIALEVSKKNASMTEATSHLDILAMSLNLGEKRKKEMSDVLANLGAFYVLLSTTRPEGKIQNILAVIVTAMSIGAAIATSETEE